MEQGDNFCDMNKAWPLSKPQIRRNMIQTIVIQGIKVQVILGFAECLAMVKLSSWDVRATLHGLGTLVGPLSVHRKSTRGLGDARLWDVTAGEWK